MRRYTRRTAIGDIVFTSEVQEKGLDHYAGEIAERLCTYEENNLVDVRKAHELIEELEQAAMPLLNYLNKYYNPHCYAVVTEGHVEILSGERVGKLPVRD